jgi:hypothetical protein
MVFLKNHALEISAAIGFLLWGALAAGFVPWFLFLICILASVSLITPFFEALFNNSIVFYYGLYGTTIYHDLTSRGIKKTTELSPDIKIKNGWRNVWHLNLFYRLILFYASHYTKKNYYIILWIDKIEYSDGGMD